MLNCRLLLKEGVEKSSLENSGAPFSLPPGMTLAEAYRRRLQFPGAQMGISPRTQTRRRAPAQTGPRTSSRRQTARLPAGGTSMSHPSTNDAFHAPPPTQAQTMNFPAGGMNMTPPNMNNGFYVPSQPEFSGLDHGSTGEFGGEPSALYPEAPLTPNCHSPVINMGGRVGGTP